MVTQYAYHGVISNGFWCHLPVNHERNSVWSRLHNVTFSLAKSIKNRQLINSALIFVPPCLGRWHHTKRPLHLNSILGKYRASIWHVRVSAVTRKRHPTTNMYRMGAFDWKEKLLDIKEALGVSHEKNIITRLTSGMYVHPYGTPLSCSNVALSLVNLFFTFRDATDYVRDDEHWWATILLQQCTSVAVGQQ